MLHAKRRVPHQKEGIHVLFSLLGWYGVLAILLAVALLNFNLVPVTSNVYRLLTLSGTLCVAAESYVKKDYQPMVLNIIVSLIVLIALFHFVFSAILVG